MRIVIAVDNFDPNKGYLEYYMAKELTKLGHKVYVLTFGRDGSVSRTTLKEGFEVVNIPYVAVIHGYHIPSFRGLAYTYKFIKREKPDIVHCEPLISPLSLLLISLQRHSTYRIVGSLVTGYYYVNSTAAKLRYYVIKAVFSRYVKGRVDSFFALNDGFMEASARLFDISRRKITIIPLGADPELFKFDAKAKARIRKELGISTNDLVVAYSGRMIPPKEIDILISALAPIIRRDHRVKLLIVGKGKPSYTRYLKELSLNLKISRNVNFHPWVHRTELPDFYSASDIAVWPGGPSNSMMEAASSGLPLIVKRSPLTKYVVAYENGFAFKRGDVDDLRGYLEILIYDDRLRREMGRKSRLFVEQKLNWRTIAMQHLNAYTHALNGQSYHENRDYARGKQSESDCLARA